MGAWIAPTQGGDGWRCAQQIADIIAPNDQYFGDVRSERQDDAGVAVVHNIASTSRG